MGKKRVHNDENTVWGGGGYNNITTCICNINNTHNNDNTNKNNEKNNNIMN